MINHELKDELPNQKLTNQFSLYKGEIDLDGKLVEFLCDLELLERLKIS